MGVAEWSELDVLHFLIDEGLLEEVDLGLVNGHQLGELSLEQCAAAVTRGDRGKKGKLLYDAIRRAKSGLRRGDAAAGLVDPEDPFQYRRLEEDMFAEDEGEEATVDLDKHRFPPLCDKPGRSSLVVMAVVVLGSALCCTVFKHELAEAAGMDSDAAFVRAYLRYASIPVLMVPFTYAHIWAALWMTFYPVRFKGCLQIPGTNVGLPGWQGIVPFKCVQMAKMAVRMLTSKLLRVEEVFSRLDPKAFAASLEPEISKKMTQVVNEVASSEFPRLWALVPGPVKAHVIKDAAREAPEVVAELLAELQERIDECFDLEGLVVSIMVNDMELSNNMFIQCADRELAFIRNSGAWMGGLFGLGQMLVSIYYTNIWVLPVVGTIAGAITNWIALFAIFNPVYPISLCGGRLVLQGLFLTRQDTVSALYGHIVQRKILTAENLNRALMQGERSDRTREIARKHIRKAFDKSLAPLMSGPLSLALSSGMAESLDRMGDRVAEAMTADMYGIMRQGEAFMDKQFDLENTLRTRMRALPPDEFEGLLHPVFQEDEYKLVLCGGALGALFGIMQAKLIGF